MKYALYLFAGYILLLGVMLYRRRKIVKTVEQPYIPPASSPTSSDSDNGFICIHLGNGRSVSGPIDGSVTVVAERISKS